MSEQQLTFLVPATARDALAELRLALGTEANPAQWMIFMLAVTRLLPDVLSVGRPSKESVKRSLIGQLGFESWQALIEAPVDSNGLGWNISGWRAWRRAWAVVESRPYLRDLAVSSSVVNTLASHAKRLGVPFPASVEEYNNFLSSLNTPPDRSEVLSDLRGQVVSLQAELADARSVCAALISQLREEKDYQAVILGERDAALKALSEAPVALPQPARLTRWQHLCAFFTGA